MYPSGVHDDPVRLVTKRLEGIGAVYGDLLVGDEFPCADQSVA